MKFTMYGPLGPTTRIERAGLVIALLIATTLMWPLRHYLTDDTFIHLRYAENLAAGQGFVFNPGERVYGCTSPLWVTLLADGISMGFDGLRVARVLGFVATLCSVVLFLQLMRRTLQLPALCAIATVAWSAHAWMLRWSLSGMETPLAVALALAGFVAFTEGNVWGSRPVRTGALWSLAALTRPEAALLLVLWGAFLLADADSRPGLRRLVFGALPPLFIYGGWLLFAHLYFGSELPQTLVAKTAGPQPVAERLANLWRQVKIVGATDGIMAALLAAALLAGGRRVWTRRSAAQRAQRMLPWVWVLAVPALYVFRGVQVLSRYLLPLLPVLSWLAWRAGECWSLGPDGASQPRVVRRTVIAGAVIAALVVAQNFAVYQGAVVPQVLSFSTGLRHSLIPIGRWLHDHTPPTTAVAAPDIGAIGYYSDRRVVDLAGLIEPRMIPFLEKEPYEEAAANFRFAAFARPEYVLDRANSTAEDLLHRSRYAAALTPVARASVPNLGIARPGPAYYTLYRVDWAMADSLGAPSLATGRNQ
jgi:arabinofuranosyltransferase